MPEVGKDWVLKSLGPSRLRASAFSCQHLFTCPTTPLDSGEVFLILTEIAST